MGAGEVLEVASTASDGVARLDTERWSEVRRLSLSHLAYQTLIVQADELPPDGVVRMEPSAISIAGLDVVGTGQVCPSADDVDARRLWTEVASLYASDTGLRALSGTILVGRDQVGEDVLRRVDESALTLRFFGHQAGTFHGQDLTRRPLADRVGTDGYAWPPYAPGGLRSARDGRRHFPELEAWHAYHFAEATFGELHNFDLTGSVEGEVTLVFCANGRGEGPTIMGTLTLVPGERFVSADWRFQTADPDEGAGGHADFTSYREAPGEELHLLAARGIFFRHGEAEAPFPDLPRDYYREVSVLETWTLHASSLIPCQPTGGTVFHDPTSQRLRDVEFVRCVTAQDAAVREP